MSLKLNASGGGSVTLQEPSTASNFVLNLPTASGTVIATAPGTSGNVLTSNGTTWESVALPAPAAPTTAQVLSATAGATAGAVGTYAYLCPNPRQRLNPNATLAGSSLEFLSPTGYVGTPAPTGTWRLFGAADASWSAVWLRIS